MLNSKNKYVNHGYWAYSFKKKDIPLVVVFAYRNVDNNKIPHFSYFKEKTYNILCLNCADNNWFQNGVDGLGTSHNETIAKLSNLINDFHPSYTIFFGFSMGAYGALLYSSYLKPNRVIALSPELDLKLDYSRSLEDLAGKNLLNENLALLLENNKETDIQIFWGDMEPIDLYFYSKYKNYINKGKVTFILGCAHYTTTYLRNINQLDVLIDSLPKSENYVLPQKYTVEPINIYSEEDAFKFYKAYNLFKDKQYNDAIEQYNELTNAFQTWAPYWWHLGRCYMKTRLFSQAEEFLKVFLEIQPDNAYYWYDLGNLLYLQKKNDKAISLLSDIVNKPMVGNRAKKLLDKIKLM